VDLRLPERVGGSSEELSARGLQLIPAIGDRRLFPVPVVLVLTGDPRRITNYSSLRRQMDEYFWWSDIATKGFEIESPLRSAIDAAMRFDSLGVHVVDPTDGLRPQLTPREWYLLRRAIAKTANTIGVDLRWWSAARRDFGAQGSPEWVKVLYGRLLFDEEHGASRLRFFKFGSRENGLRAHQSARSVGERLQHVRVIDFELDRERSLLITDNVSASDHPPLSFSDVFRSTALSEVTSLANELASQVRALGESAETQIPLSQVLWPYHDEDRLASAWQAVCSDANANRVTPVELLRRLRTSIRRVVVPVRLVHGDLHVDNVAFDQHHGRYRAYIFDPGALNRDIAVRDFAMLEISILLHLMRLPETDIIEATAPLYDGRSPGGELDFLGLPGPVLPDVRMIADLRKQAISECSTTVYALLLLDAVLMQIGGLGFTFTSNKVVRPSDAARLFDLLAGWIDTSAI
jgi:hypothetical protein